MRNGCSWNAVLPLVPSLPSTLLTSLLAVSLAGCVSLAPEEPQEKAPPPLTENAFETRINELAQSLQAQCDTSQLLESQERQAHKMNADVREIGSLLRRLSDDVNALELTAPVAPKPVAVQQECELPDTPDATKTLVGRSEWIGLPNYGTYLKARIDSGANTASLSAQEITPFERDGEDWVRFKLALNDDDVVVDAVRDEWFEAPVERRVKVVQASGEESRPVISLLITLGPIRQHAEFTLNDRTHLNFPVLLGRRFLLDIALIDVAETYLHDRPEFPGGESADDAGDDEALDPDETDE